MNKDLQRNAVSQSNTLPQAVTGNSWVATWKMPRVTGEPDYISGYVPVYQRGSFTAFKAVMHDVNPRGLGAMRIYKADIQTAAKFDPDAFQQFIADTTCVGSATYLDRRTIAQLVESLPTRNAVREVAESLERKLGVLDNIYASSWVYFSTHQNYADYRTKLIAPADRLNDYGKLWVPESQAEQLVQVEPEGLSALSDSHIYCDVLATKHALLSELGLTNSIAMDNARIAAWKSYQEMRR